MSNDELSKHGERLLTGAVVVAVLGLSMAVLQVIHHLSLGAPDTGGWLPWETTAWLAVLVWTGLYVMGWIIEDGAPLLAHRYKRWARGEDEVSRRFDA